MTKITLTPAQQRLLTELPADGTTRAFLDGRTERAARGLHHFGLAEISVSGWRLTERGRAYARSLTDRQTPRLPLSPKQCAVLLSMRRDQSPIAAVGDHWEKIARLLRDHGLLALHPHRGWYMTDEGLAERNRIEMVSDGAENVRLRGWLVYIEGRHADGAESAARALRGEPLPEGFTP